jgi:hypothetical protein
MKRFAIALVLVLGFVAGTANAQQNSISGQLCLGLPMGDFGDSYNMGFGLQGSWLNNVSPNIFVGATLGYKYFSLDDGGNSNLSGGFGTIPLMGVFRYNFETSGNVKPYIGGELGIHFWSSSAQISGYEYSSNGTDFGFTPMAGMYLPVGNMMLDLTLRYDLVMTDSDVGWIGINAGLIFPLK